MIYNFTHIITCPLQPIAPSELFIAAETFLWDVFFLPAVVFFVAVVFFIAVDLDLPAYVVVVGGTSLAAGWLDNMKLENGSGSFFSNLLCDD